MAGTAVTAGRAVAGDVTAAVKLGASAARRVVRSKLTRRIVTGVLSIAALVGVAMCGAGSESAEAQVRTAPPPQVEGAMWAAYRHAASLQCDTAGNVVIGQDDLGSRWHRPDPVLVAAIGRIESVHGTAVATNPQFPGFDPAIDAFGSFSGPILSVPLYDPADFHPHLDDDPLVSTIWDTDGGRWDLNPWVDHAVGPTQTLPSFVAAWGADGNGDGIVDPHSTWDAVATTAAFVCVQAAQGRTADEIILAYSASSDYLELVADMYPDLSAVWGELAPLAMPGGAPLVRDPQAQDRWGFAAGTARLPDPLLAALLDAVGDAALADGGLGIEPGDAECAGDLCLWRGAAVPGDVVEGWAVLHANGLGAPLYSPGETAVLVSGLLPETGATIAWPVPSAADLPTSQLPRPLFPPRRDTVSFPLPTAPWPATPLGAPDRLEWHLTPSDSAWFDVGARDGSLQLATPTPGVDVYAPVAGRISFAGDCAAVTGDDGWTWTLCGIAPTSATTVEAGSEGHTGQRLGFTAASSLQVALTEPGGVAACPQAVTRRWSRAAASPSGDWSERFAARIAARIVVLWATADDPAVDSDERDAAEAAAEALVVDLFERCMDPSAGPSPFRDRRSS